MYIVMDYTVELPLSRQEPSLVDFILYSYCYKYSKTLIRKHVGSLSTEVYSVQFYILLNYCYWEEKYILQLKGVVMHTFMLCNSALHAQIALQIKQL